MVVNVDCIVDIADVDRDDVIGIDRDGDIVDIDKDEEFVT